MKIKFTSIALYFLTITFLLSTVSFSVNAHYCGNILVDQSIVTPAKKCAMHSADTDHKDVKDNCCNEKNHVVEGQDELQLQKMDFNFEQVVFVTAFFHSYLELFNLESSENPTFKHYQPPEYSHDLQVLNQVFLI